MNYKRAIFIGVIIYFTTFLLGSLVFFISSGQIANLLGLGSLIILVALGSWHYFKGNGKKIKKSAKEGLFVGLIFLAIGTAIDFIIIGIIALLYNQSFVSFLKEDYFSIAFFVGVVFMICLPVVIAEYLRDKKN